MRTQEFIERYAWITDGRRRQCGNVFTDGDGIIYDYGYHYPLLFQVNGVKFRNTYGYSPTTAKHIRWAGGLADYDVKLVLNYHGRTDLSPDHVIFSLVQELTELDKQQKKGRPNTYTYNSRAERMEQIKAALLAIK